MKNNFFLLFLQKKETGKNRINRKKFVLKQIIL